MIMKAALYARVSSKEQEKEGYSLDAQEKLGVEYALRNNIKIVKRWKVTELTHKIWLGNGNKFEQVLLGLFIFGASGFRANP